MWNYDMFKGTGGDFTSNPVAGTTYYVQSALPPGLRQTTSGFRAYTGASINIDLAGTIAGGTTPYIFALKSGSSLPAGMGLDGTTITGKVAVANAYMFTYEVTDSSATPLALDATYTLTVTAPDPIAETQTTLAATVGKAKAFDLSATVSGGVPSYTFALASGSNAPDGFELVDGVLSGTAASAVASYSFTVVVTDALGTTKNVTYTFTAAESTGFTDDDPVEPEGGDTTAVDCLTADGVVKSRTCHPVASSASAVTWSNSWYYVTNNVTLSAGVTVLGKVSLVLADGATLTVSQSANNKAGINVTGDNSLVIYAQSNGAGAGQLIATGADSSAGIGGDEYQSAGRLVVYGGSVTANGGDMGGAGIGGGMMGNGGTVIINGGNVTAIGNATGIGGGTQGTGGTVVIKGGSVTATGGDSTYPGIGGDGGSDKQGVLRVGYNVVVKAGASTPPTAELSHGSSDELGYAIALQKSSRRYYVITTEAVAGTVSSITYIDGTDGTTRLTGLAPVEYVEGEGVAQMPVPTKTGYDFAGWYDNPALTGSPVSSISAEATGDQTFYAKWTAIEYTITYKDGTTTMTGLVPTNYTVEAAANLPVTAAKAGYEFVSWHTTSALTGGAVTTIPVGSTGNRTFYAKWTVARIDVPYMDVGGNQQVTNCTVIALTSTALTEGWYAVTGTVAISSSVTVSGDVKLILADGCSLTVTGEYNKAGIAVTNGNSLTIYAQENGTGSLTATGGDQGAGIGGNTLRNGGTITINGGTVSAIGVNGGAGIGGGAGGGGGTVTINGGTVTATAGSSGANTSNGPTGIGKGYGSSTPKGTLTVGENMIALAGADENPTTYIGTGEVAIGTQRYFVVVPGVRRAITYIDGDDGVTVLTGLEPTIYTPGTATPLPAIALKDDAEFQGWYRDAAFTDDPVRVIPADETGDVTVYAKWRSTEGDLPYLKFWSTAQFSVKLPRAKVWEGTIEYKNTAPDVNDGWTVGGVVTVMDAAKGSDDKYYLYVRGQGNTCVSGGFRWDLTAPAPVYCVGNIERLLEYGGTPQAMAAGCYQSMFSGWDRLARAPLLPATALSDKCYYEMFRSCAALTKAPALPATTLAYRCYYGMFGDCTSLAKAPDLPATTLANDCYYNMFYCCDALTTAPEVLPALTATTNCYYQMFYMCTSLKDAPALPATTLARGCYGSMFEFCASLTNAPAQLPATTLAANCCKAMFKGCSALKVAPVLPAAGTAPDSCYYGMFRDCTSLETPPPELPASDIWENCYYQMFMGCSALTNAPSIAATNAIASPAYIIGEQSTTVTVMSGRSCESMFEGCRSLAMPPNINIVKFEDKAYTNVNTFARMFYGCTALGRAVSIPAGFLPYGCCESMFEGCVSLPEALDLPATNVNEYCYRRMFYGCSAITNAPATLPAKKLGNGSCQEMFHGCINLTEAPQLMFKSAGAHSCAGMFEQCSRLAKVGELPNMYLHNECYKRMFKDCISLTNAPNLPARQLYNSCYEEMFAGCTRLRTAPEISATKMQYKVLNVNEDPPTWETRGAEFCCSRMFQNCISLEVSPSALKAGAQSENTESLARSCYSYMFRGCTSLASVPELPAVKFGNSSYRYMFEGCTSITTTPRMMPESARSIQDASCKGMFKGCSSLSITSTDTPGAPKWYVSPWTGGVGDQALESIFANTKGPFTADPEPYLPYYVLSAPRSEWTGLVQTESVLNAYAGRPIDVSLADIITGETKPYVFSGWQNVPNGLALDSAGHLVGTVDAAGTNVFTVTVSDSSDEPFTVRKKFEYTLVVKAVEPIESNVNLGLVKVGMPVRYRLADRIKGGIPPYVVVSCTAPNGFAYDAETGMMSGAAGAAGTYSASVSVTDDRNSTPTTVTFDFEAVVTAPVGADEPEEPESGTVVRYCEADGEQKYRVCKVLDPRDTIWQDGWYYSSGTNEFASGVTVKGKVCLILGDGSVLTASAPTWENSDGGPGVNVVVEKVSYVTNSLTIFGQTGGTGVLRATGAIDGPGVGGSFEYATGKVTINGGIVEAQGVENSAGIGSSANESGGTIVINGGTVRATGGEYGAGIGTGRGGSPGTVTIHGGTVQAVGGIYGAGIGGGWGVHGAVVNIYGGTVTAIGGSEGTHGIGRGWNINNNATHGHLYVHEGMRITHGSVENLPSTVATESRDPVTHEFTFNSDSPAFRWFLIEPDEHTPLAAETDLGTVVKGDRYFNRSLGMRVSDGIAPYTFALTSTDEKPGNRLPGGVELSSSGSLSGTPSEAGTFSFWVTVTDSDIGSYQRTAEFQFTLRVYDVFSIMYYEKDGTTRVFPLPATYSYAEGTGIAADDMPVPTKAGYDFAGWYTDTALTAGPVSSISANDTGDKTFYAKWTPTAYPITYKDGATTMTGLVPTNYTFESADVILPAAAAKDGYYFAGWYDNPQYSGSAVKKIPAGSTGEKIFYSKWDGVGVPFAPVANANELYGDATMEDSWDLSQTINGGKKPYTYALKNVEGNTLPAGLELSEDGVLSGTVSVAGAYSFTVVATDSLGNTTEVTYTLEVDLSKTTGDGELDAKVYIGFPASINLSSAIRGGTEPYRFELVPEYGALPSGLVLNGTKLEGTVTMKGSANFCLIVTDLNGISSPLYYRIFSDSTAQQNYAVNGVSWSWVSSSRPKQSDTITSLWNSESLASDGRSVIPVETAGCVHVPGHIGVLPVTIIGRNAFLNCAEMTRVTLPSTITDIGENAFSGCSSLTSVVISSAVQNINTNAFAGSAVETIYVGQGESNRVRGLVAASGYDVAGVTFVETTFCTLTLDAKRGNELEMPNLTMVPGVAIGNLPVPNRAGFEFGGWYTEWSGGTLVTAETTISDDTTFYAHWKKNSSGPTISATQTDLGWVKVGAERNFNLTELLSGGLPPYLLTLASELPPGFSFDASTGVLSGRAEENGIYTVKVKVEDDDGQAGYIKFILRTFADAIDEGEPAEADDGVIVQYKDVGGNTRKRMCRRLTERDAVWTTGWYYAAGNLSFPDGVRVDGNVCVILDDSAVLTMQPQSSGKAAVDVSVVEGVTNSLSIYGQSRGTGVFTAIGGVGSPGIGASDAHAAGRITVNGGMVTAIGGIDGAGIGGGIIVVNGGMVTAIGGSAGTVGIGGRLYVREGMSVTHGRRESQPSTDSGGTLDPGTHEYTFDAHSQHFRWFLIEKAGQ